MNKVTTSEATHPCGACECTKGCCCEARPGPAAFEVERGGKKMRVCTRCTMPGDEKRVLLVKHKTPSRAYARHDIEGAHLIAYLLNLN